MNWVISIGVVCAMAAGSSAQIRKGPAMQDKIKSAEAQLDEFDKTAKVEHLQKAMESLEEIDILGLKETAARMAARREMLTAWCRSLADIDRVKDPKYDPEDTPQLRVMRPSESIHQSEKQYKDAVAANEKKKADRRVQNLIRELDDRATERVTRLIERMYTKSPADRKEIEGVFTATKLSEERRSKLLK